MTSTRDEARFDSGLFAYKHKFINLKNLLLDLVFPPMCHGCGRVDTYWCDVCLTELESIPIEIAQFTPQILSDLCATGVHRGKLQQAIQALKYHNTPSVAIPLGARLSSVLQQTNWTFDTMIPVPLFDDRLRQRGYNQSYLLSLQVEHNMHIPCQPQLLSRHRNTPQQVGLTATERRENVKDAFIATTDVADKSILLIDDVVTTGSTLDACAVALFDAGAKAVYAITVSHA